MTDDEMKKGTPDTKDRNPKDKKEKKSGKKGHYGKKGKDYKRGGYTPGVNSPEFWNKVPGLLSAAGRIPSTNPMGVNYTGFGNKMENAARHNQLMVINWIPSMGPAFGRVSDPINTASQQLYTYIRQAISGARSYDAADLVQYILAVYNLHLFYHVLKLIYGSTNIVSPVNRDLARIIAEGIGVDYDDIISHKADLLFYINNLAYKLTQFAIPGGWSMLEHWKLLVSGIFSDRYVNTLKNQFYLFVPRYFYRYFWASALLQLDTSQRFIPQEGLTFGDITTYGNGLINSLVGNQDVGTMSGDILKAFEGKLEPIQPINADHTISINITSNEMLNQIRNMTFFELDDAAEFEIVQNGAYTLGYGTGTSHPKVILAKGDGALDGTANCISSLTLSYAKGYTLIGFEDHMSEDAIMVATRMMATYSVDPVSAGDTSIYVSLDSWGVEVFLSPTFLNINDGSINATPWDTQVQWDVALSIPLEECRSEFEGAPRLTYYDIVHDTDPTNYSLANGADFFSLDNFLLLPFDLLADLNYTAVQSAFYVPLAASAVSK